MNILLVNTYDSGGAAKACLRLHNGLLDKGINSKLLLLNSNKKYPSQNKIDVYRQLFPHIIQRPRFYSRILGKLGHKNSDFIKRTIKNLIPDSIEYFSFPNTTIDVTQHPWYKQADLIHFHWVSDFLDYSFFITNKKPIIWTLHDLNPFTGGCHYPPNLCDHYRKSCNSCPLLSPYRLENYPHEFFKYKKSGLSHTKNITIVALSEWLMKCSTSSSLLKEYPHYLIPNGINSNIFTPYNKTTSRQTLGIPLNKKVFLFVSNSIDTLRKGGMYIYEVMEQLKSRNDVIACTIGTSAKNASYQNIIPLGEIKNETIMAQAYSAADALIVPSIQDNLPNTIIESLLCGTPVIGFSVGGIIDLIENGVNGFLSTELSSKALLENIEKLLSDNHSFSPSLIRAKAVASYDISVSVNQYKRLYNLILSKRMEA